MKGAPHKMTEAEAVEIINEFEQFVNVNECQWTLTVSSGAAQVAIQGGGRAKTFFGPMDQGETFIVAVARSMRAMMPRHRHAETTR